MISRLDVGGTGLVLVIALVLGFAVYAQAADVGSVNSVAGICQHRPVGGVKWNDVKKKQSLKEGDSLLTGPEGNMVVSVGELCQVKMGPDTKLTLDKGANVQEKSQNKAEVQIKLESGEVMVAVVKPEGRALNLALVSPIASVAVAESASFVFTDKGTGEAVLKMADGKAMCGNVKFPDRAGEVKSFSVCTVKPDAPEGVMRGLSVAERSELDKLEPLKKAISPAWRASKRKQDGGRGVRIPQGHYAMMLARAMNLERSILGHTNYPTLMRLGTPRDVSALGGLEGTANLDDYIDALEDLGVEPLDGWNKDALLTKGCMAVILVRAYGIEDEIAEELRGDELAYMECLSDMGIVIEGSPEELVDSIIVVNTMTDPILVPVMGKTFFGAASPTLAITTLR